MIFLPSLYICVLVCDSYIGDMNEIGMDTKLKIGH